MWAFGFGSPKGERLTYRGYILEICKHPVGWRLGISPIRPELPILANITSQSLAPARTMLSVRPVSG